MFFYFYKHAKLHRFVSVTLHCAIFVQTDSEFNI